MKKEKGFLDVNIIKRFPSQFPEISFLGYVSNLVNVEKFIATAGVLAPPLIEEDGGVYLKEHYSLIQCNESLTSTSIRCVMPSL